jgi:hypothetical protein
LLPLIKPLLALASGSPPSMLALASGSPPVIHYCASLGPTCHSAEFLKQCHPLGLRRFALPFDWVHSSPALACGCVDDGFRLLLQRHLMESGEWTAQKRRGSHRHLRTATQAHIFEHHDPASVDSDFAYFQRAADRFRRLLDDRESRTLFFYLALDADPNERDSFAQDARTMYASLRRVTTNFDMVALRVVHRVGLQHATTTSAAAGEIELDAWKEPIRGAEGRRDDESLGHDALHILELPSETKTVVPFVTWREQANAAELRDMARLGDALGKRFTFDPRPDPPASTLATLMARKACGPRWVWADPPHAPRESATAAELRDAAARLPGGAHPAVPLLTHDPVPPIERIGPDARRAALAGGEVDVAAWAQEWIAQAEQAGVEMDAVEWRAAAERLSTPVVQSRQRNPRLRDLVTLVLMCQLVEVRAEQDEDTCKAY